MAKLLAQLFYLCCSNIFFGFLQCMVRIQKLWFCVINWKLSACFEMYLEEVLWNMLEWEQVTALSNCMFSGFHSLFKLTPKTGKNKQRYSRELLSKCFHIFQIIPSEYLLTHLQPYYLRLDRKDFISC